MPGMPGIAMGRSAFFVWGITAPLCDSSDLYQEKLNEDGTKYFLDGKWEDLKFINEPIKIKGGEVIDFKVPMTHRGPVLSDVIIEKSSILFGGSIPPRGNGD